MSDYKRRMRFHRISPCPKCGGKVKAKWERDGVQSWSEYTFFLVISAALPAGSASMEVALRKPAPRQLQRSIALWNRVCNGDKCFTLLYKILGGGR